MGRKGEAAGEPPTLLRPAPPTAHWEPLPGPSTGRPEGLYLDPLPTVARAQNTDGNTIPVPTLTQPRLNAKPRPGPRGTHLPVSASPRPAGLQPTLAHLARRVQAVQTLEDGEGPSGQKGCRSRPRVTPRCPRERTRRRLRGPTWLTPRFSGKDSVPSVSRRSQRGWTATHPRLTPAVKRRLRCPANTTPAPPVVGVCSGGRALKREGMGIWVPRCWPRPGEG